jgi:hypothetical protein
MQSTLLSRRRHRRNDERDMVGEPSQDPDWWHTSERWLHPPTKRPLYKKRWFWVALIVVLLIIASVAHFTKVLNISPNGASGLGRNGTTIDPRFASGAPGSALITSASDSADARKIPL